MTATVGVVVYSATTGRVRAHFAPDDDSQIQYYVIVDGEASLRIPLAQYMNSTLEQLQDAVSSATGLTPTNDRYICVDAGQNIVRADILDLSIGDDAVVKEQVPNGAIHEHPTAVPGSLYIGGEEIKRIQAQQFSNLHGSLPPARGRVNQLTPQMS